MNERRFTTKQKLRKGFLLVHRWVGIITGIVVMVVALTGCIYVFEKELRNVFEKSFIT